jgi:hypothetical protein
MGPREDKVQAGGAWSREKRTLPALVNPTKSVYYAASTREGQNQHVSASRRLPVSLNNKDFVDCGMRSESFDPFIVADQE